MVSKNQSVIQFVRHDYRGGELGPHLSKRRRGDEWYQQKIHCRTNYQNKQAYKSISNGLNVTESDVIEMIMMLDVERHLHPEFPWDEIEFICAISGSLLEIVLSTKEVCHYKMREIKRHQVH